MAVINRSNAFRTVCLLSRRDSQGAHVATGVFLLGKDGTPYLATAAHFGKHTDSSTIVELPNGVGQKPSLYRLHALSRGERMDSAAADLSLFPLRGIKPGEQKMFTSRFLTYEAILGDTNLPVDREKVLTVFGFPSGLGHDSKGALVPFSFRSYASSDYFFLNDPDYRNPLLVYALENASLGGYSGAPVFDMDSPNNGIVGFIKGNVNAGEGSVSLVTPAAFAKFLF